MTESDLSETAVPCIAPGHRMQFEPAQDCHVLLYPEGMVTLNPSAAEILSRCDGKNTIGAICDTLSDEFGGADLRADVHQFLELAAAHGWVTLER